MSRPPATPPRRTRRSKAPGGGPGRDPFREAFEIVGGPEALAIWARGEPTEFFRLFARLILAGEAAGGDRLEVEIVRFSDPRGPDAEDPAP